MFFSSVVYYCSGQADMLFADKVCLILAFQVSLICDYGPLCSFLRDCGYLLFDISLGIKGKLLTGLAIIHVLGR